MSTPGSDPTGRRPDRPASVVGSPHPSPLRLAGVWPPHPSPLQLALVGQGLAMAVLTGRAGEPLWQATRVIAVSLAVTAGYLVLASASRWRRGTVALLAGVIGMALGAGIGLRWASKAGLTWPTVAGVGCLLTGLVLVAGGAAGLIRATPRWWRLLALPASLLVLAFGWWPMTLAFAATNVPGTAVGGPNPGDHGHSFSEVRFGTSDGVTLAGWYLPSTTGRAVVLLHGAGSTRSAVLRQAEVLARHGYGVLLFDARGHGRSGGQGMDFGWYGDLDTEAAVSFLRSRPEVDADRIAAVGLSMGGEQALGALAADRRIRAVVAEGATNRGYPDKAWLDEAYGWRGWLQQRVEWLVFAETDLLTAAEQPGSLRAAVGRAAPRPVLLIAAGTVPDEGKAARWIQSVAPSRVRVWEVPGAGHTGALRAAPAEWERQVTGFLDAATG